MSHFLDKTPARRSDAGKTPAVRSPFEAAPWRQGIPLGDGAKRPGALSRLVPLLAVGLLAGGCSWFSWIPGIGGKDDKEDQLKPAELVSFEPQARIRPLWRAKIGKGLGRKYLRLDPAPLAGRIYAADGYGTVEARDRFSGKRVWRARIAQEGRADRSPRSGVGRFVPRVQFRFFDRRDPSFVSGGVGAGAGFVLVGTTGGALVALSAADGSEVWRSQVGAEILSRPATGDGAVFVQTIDGRLLALEQTDGSVRWSFDNQVPVLTLRGSASPVFNGDIVYAGFANGMVGAIRTGNGEPLWEHRVMLPEGRSELDRMVDVDASPFINGPLLYAVSYQGRLKALRAADGVAVWQQEASSYLDLAAGYGQIYVVDETDAVIAIDEQTTDEVWRQEGLYRRKLSSPVAFSNYLVVGDDDGYLHVLAQSDGRFLARRKLDGDGLRSGMAVVDGRTLYVLGNSGALHALEIEAR
ncbi:MAG: outer membrane protein assembly factor BamB [Gammaproteobacteria bacterium]|nr:outer membrane protein assembly factor BamB [Gammaproteobacteria bacterium]